MNKIFALGFFDGVHLGHQALLKECCALAREHNAQPCAITFQQHPQALFSDDPPKLINTNDDRQRLLREFGIASVFAYPVTKAVMGMPWETFLEELISAGAMGFVCGSDFRFGNRGEGNAQKLEGFCRERNLAFRVVGDQMLDGLRIFVQLWHGDEEFAPRLRCLWDENTERYLRYETTWYAVGLLMKRIKERMKEI